MEGTGIDHTMRTTRTSYIQKSERFKKRPVVQQTRLPSPAINQLNFTDIHYTELYCQIILHKGEKFEQDLDLKICMQPEHSKDKSLFKNSTIESTRE